MQTQTDNKTNIQTLAYALISAGEMQGYKAAFEKVFYLIPKDTKVRLQIDSNGHIHYENEHAPLFPAAADKTKAEAQIWEFLSQLSDRLQQYTAPENANIAHLLPSDFPQDMFAKSRYKLLLLTPVYDTYMGIRHVKHWEASLQLQVSAFKEVQLMGIKVPFAPSYPVRDATLNLTFSTGRVKNMDINFLPVNTAKKEIVPLQVAAEFLKELTAERFPHLALEMRKEGEWIRLGQQATMGDVKPLRLKGIKTFFFGEDGQLLSIIPGIVQKMFNEEYGIKIEYNEKKNVLYKVENIETKQIVSKSVLAELEQLFINEPTFKHSLVFTHNTEIKEGDLSHKVLGGVNYAYPFDGVKVVDLLKP